jgi:hypothetical protein
MQEINAGKTMRSVVITGASTGIGFATTKLLTARRYRVFGSVRKMADAERLSRELGANFTPLLFDVTDEAAVLKSARQSGARRRKSTFPPTAIPRSFRQWKGCENSCSSSARKHCRRKRLPYSFPAH